MRTTSARVACRRLSREWEITVFWLVLGLSAVVLAVWGLAPGREHEPAARPQPVRFQRSLLGPGAFAFLETASAVDATRDGDLGAILPVKETAAPVPPRTGETVATAPVAPPPSTAPAAEVKIVKTPVSTPPPGPPPVVVSPPRTRLVQYCGMMTTTRGQTVAFVKSRDPATAEEKVEFLPPGGASAQGIRICGFDSQTLHVASARGLACHIPFGKSEVIAID